MRNGSRAMENNVTGITLVSVVRRETPQPTGYSEAEQEQILKAYEEPVLCMG